MPPTPTPAPNFNQPLAEVFGYLSTDMRDEAVESRREKNCPFTDSKCHKVSVDDPLGVCSVNKGEKVVITCPNRFKEGMQIATDAADFFFPGKKDWAILPEIRLKDVDGESAGNIDMVLVEYDDKGRVKDFGALEIQAVYISGNIREPFVYYMEDPTKRASMNWKGQPKYPNPDFLSSSRKRLAPQLVTKGGIVYAWKKKSAVALDSHFFKTLPTMKEVKKEEGEIAWLIYDLVLDNGRYELTRTKIVYTRFEDALLTITKKEPGERDDFIKKLQHKLDSIPKKTK